MALSDFFRGHRDPDEDRVQDSRRSERDYGRPNPLQEGAGFARRGWRTGSDYYGNNDQRYGSRRREHDESSNFDSRAEYQGREWRSGSGHDENFAQGDNSFNDRWQNAYGSRISSSGQERSWQSDDDRGARNADQDRAQDRWWNELAGRPGGDNSMQEGHRGRGPRGYRRSDERIREDVCECLTDDHHVDASNVQVEVKDCEVTLTGTVNSRFEKRHAEDLIDRLAGVRDVHNRLRVVNEAGQTEGGQPTQASTGSQTDEPSSDARH